MASISGLKNQSSTIASKQLPVYSLLSGGEFDLQTAIELGIVKMMFKIGMRLRHTFCLPHRSWKVMEPKDEHRRESMRAWHRWLGLLPQFNYCYGLSLGFFSRFPISLIWETI